MPLPYWAAGKLSLFTVESPRRTAGWAACLQAVARLAARTLS